jgi:hypothetical protein
MPRSNRARREGSRNRPRFRGWVENDKEDFMRVITTLKRISLLLMAVLLLAGIFTPTQKAYAKTVAQWLEGYQTGAVWFGEDFAYDITDTKACWDLLMKPITVLDVDETESVYPLQTPGGDKVNNDKLGGFINGASAAVHVLGDDEDGWTLIEGLDYYNRVIRGYVKTRLLKTVTPNEHYGVIVDKLTQRLYVFIDGEYFSSCAVSTGLPNDEQPYNETSSGEYLAISWSGGFESEGMFCAMAIRFNNGDKMHEVPYNLLADGTKRYSRWEPLLGQKASHGCIRVARLANEDGLNQTWLWNNLKRLTKIVIWDDAGRVIPYTADDTLLYYNPDGGQYYHSYANCASVRDKYLPLSAFTYGELDTGIFASLEPCPSCSPAKRKSVIDKQNLDRGVITQAEYDARIAQHKADSEAIMPSESDTITVTDTVSPEATVGEVEVIIIPADSKTP